jgi:hypothetical protein
MSTDQIDMRKLLPQHWGQIQQQHMAIIFDIGLEKISVIRIQQRAL